MKTLDPRPLLRPFLALLVAAGTALGQQTIHEFQVPELAVERWFNVSGAAPSLAALRGKPVLLEFWATSVKHCGKTFPHAQAFSDRYGELGLEVFAVSYDSPQVLTRLIEQRGYRIPIGVDTSLACYQAFRINEVPRALLIGAGGELLYHGPPEAADLAIEAALGIEATPQALFEAVLASAEVDEAGRTDRALLERLVAKAPRGFDLAGWAARAAGERPEGIEPASDIEDATAGLAEYTGASRAGDHDRANALLFALAAGLAPREFDLKRWARDRLARDWPLTDEELDELLATQRHELVFEAVLYRAATPEMRERAGADAGFLDYCGHALLEARTSARSGLLAQHWVFPGVEPRSRQRLWADLGVGGLSPDAQGEVHLSIGTERVDPAGIGSFVEEQLLRYLAGRTFASRRVPDPAQLGARVAKERDQMLRELVMRHGGVKLEDL